MVLAIFAIGCDSGVFGGAPAGNPLPQNGNNSNGNTAGNLPQGTSSITTKLEQLALERINRARLRPGAEAARGGIAIDEGVPGELDATPRQAVAFSETLRSAALVHSTDMLNRDYFAHTDPDGNGPADRVRDAGYPYVIVGENLAWNGTTGALDPVQTVETQHDNLFIDQTVEGRGHRITMLYDTLREVGIATIRGSFTASDGIAYTDSLMQTQEYASSGSDLTFVLGVVYDDSNGNGEYDFDEGVAGSTVRLGGVSKSTNDGGGYTFQVGAAGDYTLSFESGRQVELTIASGDANIKVDSIDGDRVSINLGVGLLKQ